MQVTSLLTDTILHENVPIVHMNTGRDNTEDSAENMTLKVFPASFELLSLVILTSVFDLTITSVVKSKSINRNIATPINPPIEKFRK